MGNVIRSMTGFGKAHFRNENLKLVAVIKSVNGKGLEINTRLPKELVIYEKDLRNRIKEAVYRGNVFLGIQLEFYKIKPSVRISDLASIVEEIIAATKALGLSISDDLTLQLAMKFYNPTHSEDAYIESDEFRNILFDTFERALNDFIKSKEEEGLNLLADIEKHLRSLERLLEEVEKRTPILVERYREKLLKKARELLNTTENAVVVNELKLLLEKTDINEEVQRLKSHLRLFKEELKKGFPIGKKLEFITQEMLREVNTMGNKLPDLFPLNVEMKTEIDKLRQQVANIE